jgi:hypothetical protein
MPYNPQFLSMEFVQGEIDPSSQLHQSDVFAERQMIPPPQFPEEQHACSQTPRGVLGAHGEQLVDRQMGIVAAGRMVDPSNLNSEAIDVSEMSKYVNLDSYDVQYDGAS